MAAKEISNKGIAAYDSNIDLKGRVVCKKVS